MKAKLINTISIFRELCVNVPYELREYINKCKETPQSKIWHPEGNCYNHINIVYNRARQYGDLNLSIAAFFHDLGKVDTTKVHPTKPGAFPAHGHELVSLRLVEKYKDWIEEQGANFDIVHYVVKNHMRIQQINNMRHLKREMFKKDKYFSYVEKFSEFDDMSNLTHDELNIR